MRSSIIVFTAKTVLVHFAVHMGRALIDGRDCDDLLDVADGKT